MTVFHPGLAEVVRNDPRYSYEAYEFVFYALHHTQKLLGREPADGDVVSRRGAEPHHHVSGPELLAGIRDLALREFGRMARTVFRLWGIDRTDDFGEIIFNLIDSGMMSKTDEDSREDFHAVYDLDQALIEGFRFQPLDTALEPSGDISRDGAKG
ncbi:MAG: hypothetical protein IT429_19375 [Gemmataceae bacterium]|nr:hypothetical protein [Gemmataceae bacterium]